MQDFAEIKVTDLARDAIMQLADNVKTVASQYAGTSFPTDNLYVGMTCMRTDQNAVYVCTSEVGNGTWVKIDDLNIQPGEDDKGNVISTVYATKSNVSSQLTELDTAFADETKILREDMDVLSNECVKSVTARGGLVTVAKGNGDTNTFYAGLNILTRNKAYKEGEIAYSPSLASGLYLECTEAGVTAGKEPDLSNAESGIDIPESGEGEKQYQALFDLIYPVGSIYITVYSSNPSTLFGGTWEKVSGGLVLQSADGDAGTTRAAGLPNITGGPIGIDVWLQEQIDASSGALVTVKDNKNARGSNVNYGSGIIETRIDASKSNPIYGNSETVQPPAYMVNIWRRTA